MLRRLIGCLIPKRSLNFLFFLCCALILQNNETQAQYIEGLKIITAENKYGFVNENGKAVIPAIYDEVQDFRESYTFVRLGKWGEIDKRGDVIIPTTYDSIARFSSGAILVRMGDRFGLMRRDGKVICPVIYDDITVWYNLFVVKQSGKWGLIDQKGTVVLPIEYDTAPEEELYDLTMKKAGVTYTIDYKGEVIPNTVQRK